MSKSYVDGIDEINKRLEQKINEVEKVTLSGLIRGGVEVKRTAQDFVPVDTGNLRASAYIIASKSDPKEEKGGDFPAPDGDISNNHQKVLGERETIVEASKIPAVEVGFTASYAVYVHENPNVGAANPRSAAELGHWKFLQSAMEQSENEIIEMIQEEAKKAL